MKSSKIIAFIITVFIIQTVAFSELSISPDGTEPHPAAIIDLISNDKGVLFPRMSTDDREEIDTEPEGDWDSAESLIIFNETTNCFETYLLGSWHEMWCLSPYIESPCKDYENEDSSTGFLLVDSRDDEEYELIELGGQCWMAENLAYLPEVHNNSDFETQGNNQDPGYGVYGYNGDDVNDAKNHTHFLSIGDVNVYENYGVLYNWWAAMGQSNATGCNGTGAPPNDACDTPVQGACPDGWHLPSDYEWTTLERYICNDADNEDCDTNFPYDESDTGYRGNDEGDRLKYSNWCWSDPCATSGFAARMSKSRNTTGTFPDVYTGSWWSSSGDASGFYRRLRDDYTSVFRNEADKSFGYSVRCVRD